ncbi:hypothetical protein D3C87_2031930 [compost metagenome]
MLSYLERNFRHADFLAAVGALPGRLSVIPEAQFPSGQEEDTPRGLAASAAASTGAVLADAVR